MTFASLVVEGVDWMEEAVESGTIARRALFEGFAYKASSSDLRLW